MNAKINLIIALLNSIKATGRTSIEGLLYAIHHLKRWDGQGKSFDYEMIQAALEQVTVRGERDLNSIVRCYQLLDEVMKEDPHDGHDKQGEDDHN